MTLALEIRRRELALTQVEKAINAIGRCACADEHRDMLAKLEHAKQQLTERLAELRYAARHSEARA
jgi:hypothetical protein